MRKKIFSCLWAIFWVLFVALIIALALLALYNAKPVSV